jgi:hypothetical protein
MRKLIGYAALATLLGLPAVTQAQRRGALPAGPKNELGVDLAFQFIDRGAGVGGGVQLASPVDVRWGFMSRSNVHFEVRGSLAYDSKLAGGEASMTFSPGINVLYQLKRGSGTGARMRAPYLTGGAGLNIVKAGAAGTETQFALGGGVGTRLPAGGLVFRPEGYVAYAFESGFLPRAFTLGVRAGFSFWH